MMTLRLLRGLDATRHPAASPEPSSGHHLRATGRPWPRPDSAAGSVSRRRRHATRGTGARAVRYVLRRRLWALVLVGVQGCAPPQEASPGRTLQSALVVRQLGLDTPRLQASAGPQWQPSVSGAGGVLFAGWTDCRFDSCIYYDAVGARLTERGALLDPTGILISGPESQFGAAPVGAFLQDQLLLAWNDEGPYRGWYRFLAVDGGVLTRPDRLTGLPPDSYGGYPSVSAANDHALVVWDSFDGPEGVGMAVLLPDGRRATPDGGLGLGPPLGARSVRTVWTGAEHLVAFDSLPRDGGVLVGVAAVQVDGGRPLAQPHAWLGGPEPKGSPVVAASGGAAVVAWPESAAPWGIQFCARGDDGGFSAPAPWVATPGRVEALALAPADGGYLVLRSEVGDGGSSLLATAVTADGGARGPDRLIATSRFGAEVALTPVDGGFYAVWTQDDQVVGAPLGPDGDALGPPSLLSRSANAQVGSSVGVLDGGYLVSWLDNREDAPGLRLSRVSLTGEVESPAGVVVLPVVPRAGSVRGSTQLVSTSEALWLVARVGSELLFYLLDGSGSAAGPVPQYDAGNMWSTSGPVPHGADLVWAGGRDPNEALYRLGPDGRLRAPEGGRPLPPGFSPPWILSLASTGRRLLAVNGAFSPVAMRWMEEDGGVTDAGAFQRATVLGYTEAFGGEGAALLVDVSIPPNVQLRTLRIREDGTWIDSKPVQLILDAGTGPLNQGFVASGTWVGDGWELAIAWGPRGTGPSALVRVPIAGPTVVRDWIPVGVTAAAARGPGQVLVSTGIQDESPGVMAERVQLHLATGAALGEPCNTAGACASGACEGGVCTEWTCAPSDCSAPAPAMLRVGCGCGAQGAPFLLAAALLALLRGRGRRRSS